MVPLPYATLPATLASYVLLVEYGVHRYDLEAAVTGSGRLAPEVGDTVVDLLGLTLPALASPGSDPACERIRFEPEGRRATTLDLQDGTWTPIDDPSDGSGMVRGTANAVALFVLGRIPETDDRLAVEPDELLTGFKTMFPGP